MTAQTGQVTRLRAEVLSQLAARRQADRAAGNPPLRPADEEAMGRQLIADALDDYARDQLTANRPVLALDAEEELGEAVFNALFRLNRIQRLLDDPGVENVNANGADQVFVRYADGRRERVEPIAESDEELVELLRTAAARLGLGERRFDLGSPRLSLQLPDGSRLFAVMAVTARPTLSIRRHRYLKVTPDDLVGMGTIDVALREFVRAVMRTRKCCIVCGGTGAGKTTFLRAMAADVPAAERLITIEDSLELSLDRYPELHPDVVALEAREPNVEGEGGVSLAELVRWALRMSPDRVWVGEARGEEVLALLNAMSQGTDGSAATLHASSSRGAFAKLATHAIQAPERLPVEATNLLIANAVHFVIQGAEVGAVEHGQPDREGGGGADDHLDRGAGAGPAGLHPQPHRGLFPGGRREGAEQFPEPAGLVLGGQHQGGDDQVTGRVGDVVGELAQRGHQPVPLQPHRQGHHLPADREWGQRGGRDDGLFQAGRAGHRVAQHLRPAGDRLDPRDRRAWAGPAREQSGQRPAGEGGQGGADRPAWSPHPPPPRRRRRARCGVDPLSRTPRCCGPGLGRSRLCSVSCLEGGR